MMSQPPTDGGPVYFETDLSSTIVEPVNMASAAVFIVIAGYWWWKIHGRYKQHPFLAVAAPLLLIGGIGGTLYHGFRQWHLAYLMDWVPILLLCIMAAAYFIRVVSGHWRMSFLVVAGFLIVEWLIYRYIPAGFATNFSYAFMAAAVLVPTWLVLRTIHFQRWHYIVGALIFFAVALGFRIVDYQGWLPTGTHFLWHIFGALACYQMFSFVWSLEQAFHHTADPHSKAAG